MLQSFKITRKLQINIDSHNKLDQQRPMFQSERNILISTPSLYQKLKLKPIQEFQIVTQANNYIQTKSSIKSNTFFKLNEDQDQMKQQCPRQNQKKVSFCDKVLIIEPQKGVIKRQRISTKDEQFNVTRTPKRKNCILIHPLSRTLNTCQSTFIDQL
ncbi:unnamed protein product (macronuclear) [Paramecium tetraurelia]|uniref:Uncharacterized protein n=1 Tax=Paramecium tetraurelia TaxID=5888 RepID=A0DM73_PARTE|nr:uncharacterized protein GSPATT00018358001 [Paramecium tetraurelia]CAK84140.1 unnamed protein product [Paramecium tetraurelia]|eukprot:XP_001451537.1 hypothetical protein (macronuclear) [Paramecium tetraurelia strain d4-2]